MFPAGPPPSSTAMVHRTENPVGTSPSSSLMSRHNRRNWQRPGSVEPFHGRVGKNSTSGMVMSDFTCLPPSNRPIVVAFIWALYILNVFIMFMVLLELSFQIWYSKILLHHIAYSPTYYQCLLHNVKLQIFLKLFR